MPGPPRAVAGEADRERAIGVLREHFVQGRLDAAELDRRVGGVLAAEFTDEIAGAVADLPSLVPAGQPQGRTRRGHGHATRPRPGWLPTDERFRDPTTKVVTRVWIDPADQSRHYIPEPD